MKVYIAGSSSDTARVKKAGSLIDDPNIELVGKWVADIESEGEANSLDLGKRHHYAMKDLMSIDTSDLLWFLVPTPPAYSDGGFTEVGFALASGTTIITSGSTKRSIFCALTCEYETDEEAASAIISLANEKKLWLRDRVAWEEGGGI